MAFAPTVTNCEIGAYHKTQTFPDGQRITGANNATTLLNLGSKRISLLGPENRLS